jgi:hypothetical protein
MINFDEKKLAYVIANRQVFRDVIADWLVKNVLSREYYTYNERWRYLPRAGTIEPDTFDTLGEVLSNGISYYESDQTYFHWLLEDLEVYLLFRHEELYLKSIPLDKLQAYIENRCENNMRLPASTHVDVMEIIQAEQRREAIFSFEGCYLVLHDLKNESYSALIELGLERNPDIKRKWKAQRLANLFA